VENKTADAEAPAAEKLSYKKYVPAMQKPVGRHARRLQDTYKQRTYQSTPFTGVTASGNDFSPSDCRRLISIVRLIELNGMS